MKPGQLPVDVFFVFESSRLVHLPGFSLFREKWLRDVIQNKEKMFVDIKFWLNKQYIKLFIWLLIMQLIHLPDFSLFREKWLRDVIQNKEKMFVDIKFWLNKQYINKLFIWLLII